MSRAFDPRAVLGLVLFGALTFVALLWFIGQGDTGPEDNGAAHAASKGLTGFSGLAAMLAKQGYDVSLSRSRGGLQDEALLVLTPPAGADADELEEIIEDRRYAGPTLLILPKWFAYRLPRSVPGAKQGWVQLYGSDTPEWSGELDDDLEMKLAVAKLGKRTADWHGLGMSGKLPVRAQVLGLDDGRFSGLVRDSNGRDLVAYTDDEGCYPLLDAAAGLPEDSDCEPDEWNLMVAFEPDLFNNYGLADRDRALLAARVIELAREGEDIPVVFDLTLNGFGATKNLLTLAFQPPFLAATLCLLIALIVVGWRAFGRFGPPLLEGRTIAFGKAQLAANAAGFIRRSGRFHLLGGPYTALVARRLASSLGLRHADPEAIDVALARRAPDSPSFSHLARQLETARGASQTLRAAHALKSLERTVSR